MNPETTFAVAAAAGFAFGAALGFRASVKLTEKAHYEVEYTVDSAEASEGWS